MTRKLKVRSHETFLEVLNNWGNTFLMIFSGFYKKSQKNTIDKTPSIKYKYSFTLEANKHFLAAWQNKGLETNQHTK